MLKPEEITLEYNLFLGRNPESSDVINNLSQITHTVEQLREIFIQSPEFRQRIAFIPNRVTRVPCTSIISGLSSEPKGTA